MNWFSRIAILTALMFAAAGGSVLTQAVNASKPPAPKLSAADSNDHGEAYRIGPEDVLEVVVWKNADLTRTVQVRPDGRISLPLVNDVVAANLTPMQLREVLVKAYTRYFTDPELSVSVREVHSMKVSVIGIVKLPGRYEFKSAVTVLDALALAGGFGEFAKRDRVIVSRLDGTQRKRLLFDYSRLLAGNDEENFLLQPGDIIVVPE